MSSPLNLVVFFGSVRQGRMCERVGSFVINALKKRNHDITIFDPLKEKFEFVNKPLHWYRPNEQVPENLANWGKKLEKADGFVVISGEYNHAIPPALSNSLAHFGLPSFGYKPASIITYSVSPIGGARAAVQLRALLGELGLVTPPASFPISEVQNKLDGDGTVKDQTLVPKLELIIKQLEWYGEALKNQRKQGIPK